MANNIETGVVYDVHDSKGNKLGRGILKYISFCSSEARFPENCFYMTHFVTEDGTKLTDKKFSAKEHELKGKGTERSTDAHKIAFGAAGGRRKTRKTSKGRKASRRNGRR
jgi:hypothetical protein